MHDFSLITDDKLETLRAMIAAGTKISACELIEVRWPAPAGPRFYAFAQFDEAPNFREGLAARKIAVDVAKTTGYFTDLEMRDESEEDSVAVELLDHDGRATALLQQHGAGHQVEVFMYFPQVDALVSLWWGQLRPPREGGGPILKCTAASGFRNAKVLLPRRVLFAGCQAPAFGGLLATQAEIDEHKGCLWNRHLPGGTMGLAGSELLPPCKQSSRSECALYWGDDLMFVGAATVIEAIVNYNRGVGMLAYSRGNETNLKEPVRVVFGERKVRDLSVSAYTRQTNTKHPDQGFVRVLVPGTEGPIQSMRECAINERVIGLEHLNVRLGEPRQPRTGFSPNAPNMSWTSHFFGVWGQVDPAQYSASNLKGSYRVEGLCDIRVYSDAGAYVEQYTRLRAWCLMETLRNPRWGRGYKDERFVIEDWLELAAFDAASFSYKTADGVVHTQAGSTYNAELVGRPGGDQIRDICLYGRYGLPFRHKGKVRAVPLRKETIDDSIPVFTDAGAFPNIQITNESSQLFWSQIDPAEMTNEIVLTFEDAAHDNIERPLTFRDTPAQQAAAASLGDTGVHVVQKPYSASGAGGVTSEAEAIRLGWMLLDLGEFDTGGLKNNLKVWFTTNVFETLKLRKYQLIRIVSSKIAGFGFEYFRVMSRTRASDLYAVVTAQAYPVDYYEQMQAEGEDAPILPGPEGTPNPGGRPGDRPEEIPFDLLEHTSDRIRFRLRESAIAP